MNEPRRPIFWFLWPRPDPDAPVDDAYVQVRLVRATPRGPLRIAALTAGSLAFTILTTSAVMAALTTPLGAVILVVAAIAATAVVSILRGWVVGTYVNDAGVVVETTWRRRSFAWADVVNVACQSSRVPLLGLPIRIDGERVVLHLVDGTTVTTHVYSSSPDLLWRPEAFDIARRRLESWSDRA